MAFIEIDNLQKHYGAGPGTVRALDGVTLNVEEGAFLGVMGASGSGKSTFLSLLGGLCLPSAGRACVDGIDIFALSQERLADFRREYLGFVFQAHNLVPYLNAIENVMLPLAVKNTPAREKVLLAEQALERVGLATRTCHLPSQLSGGEQERVAIARAIVNRPPLLLADEPTGSLDTATSAEILELLSELNREGQTVVMVTHNRENIRYFHRTLVLRDGRVDAIHHASQAVAEAI